MADIIDTAAEIEELQRNAALSAHRIDRNAVSAERCAGDAARISGAAARCRSRLPDVRQLPGESN
jgi:hypothetical protein